MQKADKASILVVDDEPAVLFAISAVLREEGYDVYDCGSAAKALDVVQESSIEVVVTDIKMPGISGIELLERVHDYDPELPVILMTGYADFNTSISAIKKGAFDFVMKPVDCDHLCHSINKALASNRSRRLEQEYKARLEEAVLQRTQELKEKMAELERAKNAALESLRVKSEFLGMISHELRTPLNGIIGITEIAFDKQIPDEHREYLALIRQSADALRGMIDSLLTFSKIDAGKAELEEEGFDLRVMLEGLVRFHSIDARRKGIAILCTVDPDIPPELIGDAAKLRHILTNLLNNAVKFTEKGEIAVQVTRGQASSPDRIMLVFSVSDTGIGIPEGYHEKIFDSFVQVDGSMTKKYGGVGLGLPIASQFARLMGGEIRVESKVGAGSTFSVMLDFGSAEGD